MECEFSPISFELRRSALKNVRAVLFSFLLLPDLFVRPAPTLLCLFTISLSRAGFFFFTLQTQLVQSTSADRPTGDYNGGARAAVRLMRSGKIGPSV